MSTTINITTPRGNEKDEMMEFIMQLFGYKKIYIQLHDGAVEKTLVKPMKIAVFDYPKGTLSGYRFWFTKTGSIFCLEDGTVKGSSYIVKWQYR